VARDQIHATGYYGRLIVTSNNSQETRAFETNVGCTNTHVLSGLFSKAKTSSEDGDLPSRSKAEGVHQSQSKARGRNSGSLSLFIRRFNGVFVRKLGSLFST
jgi:hypothetical protein